MKVAVTGSTGMIGSELIRLALVKGDEVTAIVRPGSSRRANLPEHENLTVLEADISDYPRLVGRFECDMFFHLAWKKTSGPDRDNAHLQAENIQYALDAVDLAHSCGSHVFVGAGSQAEFGTVDRALDSTVPVDPSSGYGIAKYAAGKLCGMACSQYGMRFCWARILSVYGERDGPNSLISYLIDTLIQGGVPELTPCEQTWDYLYCKDAADALYRLGLYGHDGRTYCLGSGEARSLRSYVEDVREAVGGSTEVRYGVKPYYPHQPMCLYANISQLSQDTGFVPRHSFKEGIQSVVAFRRSMRDSER